MSYLFRFLCFAVVIQYVTSQISMVESGPGTVKPTESLELTCKVSGASLTDSTNMYGVSWFRQSESNKFEWLGDIFHTGSSRYNPSLQSRLSLSRNTNNGEVFLKITGMKPEDSRKYYCARYSSRDYFDVWSPGTMVTVTSASSAAPSLFPLISCGTSQEQRTTIGCLARDFLPDSIGFSWADKTNKSINTDIVTFKPVLQSEGRYLASSQLQVLTESWTNGDAFYCTGKHPQGTKTVAIQISILNVPRKPIVTIHAPMKEDIVANENATIVCIANGYSPNNIEIKWEKNHGVSLKATKEETVSDENGGFVTTSFIVVSKHDWDRDAMFSCIVIHPASNFSEMKNISKSSVCETSYPTAIKVSTVAPSFETIYFQNTAPLTCIISNMASKEGLEVTWFSQNTKLTTTKEDPIYDSSSGTYSAKAIASVCPEDWKTKTFECRVSHPDLPRVAVVTLSKPNGQYERTPTVLLYPPHQDDLAKKESVTMTCVVKGFSPSDIFVKWFDSDNVEQSHVVTTKPVEEITSSNKKTYILYSTLTLASVEDWNSGKSYTCIVGHESLPLNTTQRTIDKNSGKPTNVNVSLVMSDSC